MSDHVSLDQRQALDKAERDAWHEYGSAIRGFSPLQHENEEPKHWSRLQAKLREIERRRRSLPKRKLTRGRGL